MMIDAVTESQRETLERIRDGQPLPANRRVSAVALVRLGFLDHDDETNAYALNAVGRAVFDEDALRANQAADFRVGEAVERSEFRWIAGDQCYGHIWEPYTVVRVGKSRLSVHHDGDPAGFVTACEPGYFRHVPKESPIMSDTPTLAPDVLTLPLDQIVVDSGTQARARIDPNTVADYAADLQAGDVFPPLAVVYTGDQYLLVDGFHRLAAARQLGLPAFAVTVQQGDARQAAWESFGGNRSHGLPLSNEDKRRVVRAILGDPEWAQFADSVIARHIGVSPTFVGTIRALPEIATLHVGKSAVRIGADGRAIDTSNIGRTPKPEPALEVGDTVKIRATGAVGLITAIGDDGRVEADGLLGRHLLSTLALVEKGKPGAPAWSPPAKAEPPDVVHVAAIDWDRIPQGAVGVVTALRQRQLVELSAIDCYKRLAVEVGGDALLFVFCRYGAMLLREGAKTAAALFAPPLTTRNTEHGEALLFDALDVKGYFIPPMGLLLPLRRVAAYRDERWDHFFRRHMLRQLDEQRQPEPPATLTVPIPETPVLSFTPATSVEVETPTGEAIVFAVGDRVITRTGHRGEVTAINGVQAKVFFSVGGYHSVHKLTDLTLAEPAEAAPTPLAVETELHTPGIQLPAPAPIVRPGVFADLAPLPWTLANRRQIFDAQALPLADFASGLETVAEAVVEIVNGALPPVVTAPAIPADIFDDLCRVQAAIEKLERYDFRWTRYGVESPLPEIRRAVAFFAPVEAGA